MRLLGNERRAAALIGVALALVACTSGREARAPERPTAPSTADGSTESTTPDETADEADDSSPTTDRAGTSSTSSTSSSTSTTVAAAELKGTAVAGSAGAVEAAGPPFSQTDAFSEAVRLSDGTCVGWPEGQGGSTAGLAVGAPVIVLDAVANQELGRGSITASRWEDMSAGGEQWNCFFDFTAAVSGAPPEVRIKVANLEPWTARPDPTNPTSYVASVSTGADIARIASCPPVPAPPSTAGGTTTPTVATTASAQLVSGWNAVGQYWSRGVDALCAAGLPVTAVARPCRPVGVGSEYIAAVVDSDNPSIVYANGSPIPLGTELTVSIATGRLCG